MAPFQPWAAIKITSRVKTTLTVKDAWISWGKFIRNEDDIRGDDIGVGSINGLTIKPHGKITICSAGRNDSTSGTEAGCSLYDGDNLVCKLYWSSPWAPASPNEFQQSEVDLADGYVVMVDKYNKWHGALGYVDVLVGKLAGDG